MKENSRKIEENVKANVNSAKTTLQVRYDCNRKMAEQNKVRKIYLSLITKLIILPY